MLDLFWPFPPKAPRLKLLREKVLELTEKAKPVGDLVYTCIVSQFLIIVYCPKTFLSYFKIL